MPLKVLRFAYMVIVLALVSCGAQPRAPETVEITLTEFSIESPVTTFEAGKPYRFIITNAGALNHEFTVMPPMMTAPVEMEGHSMEDMLGAVLHIGEDQLVLGATVTVDFTFTEPTSLGDLEFACHLPGHYEGGMFAPISVNG
jgi:uncharacterized cupredoxin-like copper-binding protein